jgi:hypothetical protein
MNKRSNLMNAKMNKAIAKVARQLVEARKRRKAGSKNMTAFSVIVKAAEILAAVSAVITACCKASAKLISALRWVRANYPWAMQEIEQSDSLCTPRDKNPIFSRSR